MGSLADICMDPIRIYYITCVIHAYHEYIISESRWSIHVCADKQFMSTFFRPPSPLSPHPRIKIEFVLLLYTEFSLCLNTISRFSE